MEGIDLIHGDCLEHMKRMPDNSVDMVLTDPPYGMNLSPQRKSGKFHGVKVANDDTLLWSDSFFKELFRVTKNNTGSFIFCNHFCISEFISSAKRAGFEIKNIIIWDKGHFGMGGNWRPVHEMILLLTKGRFVCKSKNLRNIIQYKKVHHSKAVHPTQKPVELLEHLIVEPDYNPKVILDPFMGSGSTGVACVNTNRKFIGIELEESYFNIAKERIKESLAEKRLW